jgi:hypothetical protein
MSLDGEWAVRQLRWTRSSPPGRAGEEAVRASVYVAALQQFEELLSAARHTGPASCPLPLFYALSQAGRAIVAAHGNFEQLYGHGLSEGVSKDARVEDRPTTKGGRHGPEEVHRLPRGAERLTAPSGSPPTRRRSSSQPPCSTRWQCTPTRTLPTSGR